MDFRDKTVVYVHPFGTPEDDVIPYGIVGLMNSIVGPRAGFYAHELSDRVVAGASAVLLDVHWYHNLSACRSISEAIRTVSPRVPVVLGGYTASIFAGPLVESGVADYVLVGDAEGSFPRLIEALRTGGDVRGIPNLVGRELRTPRDYRLTREAFDSFDYLTIDWFPSLQSKLYAGQSRSPVVVKMPLVAAYKGCQPKGRRRTRYCLSCYGQPETQRELTGRNLVSRSASRLREDLRKLSADPGIHRVCIFDDFISMLGEDYASEVFGQSYDLALYMEPHRFFPVDVLRRMAGCFRGVELVFYHEDLASRILDGDDATTEFLETARECQVQVGICVVEPPSLDLREAADSCGLALFENEHEAIELPDPFASEEDTRRSFEHYLETSFSFFLFKLFGLSAPDYLDAMALQLGLVEDPSLRQAVLDHIEKGETAARCIVDNNPLHRQIMSGGNPFRLTFYAAPFALPADRAVRPIDRIPRSRLLAAPVKIEAFEYRLGERPSMQFVLEFDILRSGSPDCLAVNFVSGVEGAMTNLPYDELWKMCIPLQPGHFLRAGEHAQIRVNVD